MAIASERRNRIRLTDDFDGARSRRGPGWPGRGGTRLAEGDAVAVVATGFAVPPAALRAGLARVASLGLVPRVGAHVLARSGYLAGSDRERASDLNRALRDPRVRGIWFARGGYGTARLLDALDWDALARHPRVLIGYSDLTALYAPVLARTRTRCLYGPGVAELANEASYDPTTLAAALRGEPLRFSFPARAVLRHGVARGTLAGGNLCVLAHLLGTPHAPELGGRILFLEDVGEEAYRIDRMLQHLSAAGALDGVRGVLLGGFGVPRRRRAFPPDRPLLAILREYLLPLGVPVVRGLAVGHVPGKRTLPLGARATLDTRRGTLDVAP